MLDLKIMSLLESCQRYSCLLSSSLFVVFVTVTSQIRCNCPTLKTLISPTYSFINKCIIETARLHKYLFDTYDKICLA